MTDVDGAANSNAVQLALGGHPQQAWELLNRSGDTGVDRLNRRLLEADGFANGSRSGREVPTKIAIVSLLFNWPSTGGGIVHTAELCRFLQEHGFEICHFYAVHSDWSVGNVEGDLPYESQALTFDLDHWNRDGIVSTFRQAVRHFAPDAVIVTDSWNAKPMLATAVSEFPYFLRLAALECLCPLNNVRLLPNPEGGPPVQCHLNQLASRESCLNCVQQNQPASGGLHRAERELAMFEDPAYESELKAAFANAAGVLAVNPLIGAACEPYTPAVHVIPSGFDEARFTGLPSIDWSQRPFRFLFAGLIEEYMKGFHVLFEAGRLLWNSRRDFEIHVTANDGPYEAPFLQYRGWQCQESLPAVMADCHCVVVPTVAQEALGRTAVEAMGAGRPVIASRIGGLPFTVVDGITGLLAQPGDPTDLVRHMATLLDEPERAMVYGHAGCQRFLKQHTWEHVIRRQYVPLFESMKIHS